MRWGRTCVGEEDIERADGMLRVEDQRISSHLQIQNLNSRADVLAREKVLEAGVG